MRSLTLSAAVLLALLGSETRAGELRGTVRYAGPAPSRPSLATNKDRAVCGDQVEDESLLVTEGRLANVVLVVKGAPARAAVTARLDQERCRYRPHVQAVPAGSTLEITNGDELLHSVHGWVGKMSRFEVVTPSKGDRIPTKLEKPGLVQVRCDVHAWMSAVVLVADAPAAVSGRDGTFEIRDLPAGTFTVTAWHERLGEKSLEVTVPARGPVELELSYGP